MSNRYREPSIDASYQISVQLAKRFQRKFFFRNQPIRIKNCLWWPCLLTDQNGMSNSHRGSSIDASYQVSVHLAKLFQSRRFLEIDQSETRIPCGDHVCKRIRMKWATFIEPSIDASYQVSVHLAKRFQRRRCCRNQPIRNMNCLWQPCLVTERDGMNNLNRGPSIDASYQVSDHLAKRFQGRKFLEIDQSERRIPSGGHVC